jgi:hypothetical protein
VHGVCSQNIVSPLIQAYTNIYYVSFCFKKASIFSNNQYFRLSFPLPRGGPLSKVISRTLNYLRKYLPNIKRSPKDNSISGFSTCYTEVGASINKSDAAIFRPLLTTLSPLADKHLTDWRSLIPLADYPATDNFQSASGKSAFCYEYFFC